MTSPDSNSPNKEGIEQYRDYLYRYALVRLRDEARADDVVQETLLAAFQSASGFAGKSTIKTWLTGILKHKIIDTYRRQSREQVVDGDGDDIERISDESYADVYFETNTEKEHWRETPCAWSDPEQSFEQKRFWEVFEQCNQGMSKQASRVFTMRELMGMETEEICKELSITSTNCWVLLYRARMNLRQCLETRWLAGATT